jgi:hypothetical protein
LGSALELVERLMTSEPPMLQLSRTPGEMPREGLRDLMRDKTGFCGDEGCSVTTEHSRLDMSVSP